MKTRSLLTALTVALGLVLGWWLEHRRRAVPARFVPIADATTIDFSSGHPVVKDSPEERAIIAAAVKEMDTVAKDVTFPARPAPDSTTATPTSGPTESP